MSNDEEKLKSMQEMGFDREVSQKALEAAGGDLQKAINMIPCIKALEAAGGDLQKAIDMIPRIIHEDTTNGEGETSDEEKLKFLQEMGFGREVSQKALEAAGGDLRLAIDMIPCIIHEDTTNGEGETNAANQDGEDFPLPKPPSETSDGVQVESRGDQEETTFDYVGKQPKVVLDHYGKKLLGDKHADLRAKLKAGYKGMQSSWRAAVEKMKEFDEQHQISAKGSELIQTCDNKMKEFDEKHQWSQKTGAAATGVNESAASVKKSALRAYDSAKTSFRNLKISETQNTSSEPTATSETTSS